jgi:hypothetical protein
MRRSKRLRAALAVVAMLTTAGVGVGASTLAHADEAPPPGVVKPGNFQVLEPSPCTPREREFMYRYYVLGWSLQAISAAYHVSVNYARMIINRGTQKMCPTN